ncbi:MAG: hypothetical protein PHW98_05800 [Candidatus Omnitrophica bacterium]|nr:hypothetical protein [Candidatus Omnitrophota bacterium]MDD5771325.1 hypothetical protein [Candidatus Omnitrophota bacterium]
MKVKGFSLSRMMILFTIFILLAVIAFPYLTTSEKASAAAAKEAIRKLSIAAENYATSHSGAYPASVDELGEFIASAGKYCASATGATTVCGEYSFACTLGSGGYTFSASPVVAGSAGNITYTATTGGLIDPS